ncbi:MAG: hypothetical protein GY737_00190 [Desulfobacteraceae bacterium]|nr:hypothetical protein [Desulfobacteraceae bacterium]
MPQMDPTADQREKIHNGTFGPTQEGDYEATIRVTKYSFGKECPPYDPEGLRAPWLKLQTQCRRPGFGDVTNFVDESCAPNSGSRGRRWLEALGVEFDDNGNFDDEEVVSAECTLVMGGLKENKKNPADPYMTVLDVLPPDAETVDQ